MGPLQIQSLLWSPAQDTEELDDRPALVESGGLSINTK